MREGLRSRTAGNGVNSPKNEARAIATGVETSFEIDKTDYTLWRLKVEHGRQTWHYITPEEAKTWPQSIPDKFHLGMETVLPPCALGVYMYRTFRNLLRQRRFARLRGMACRFTRLYKPKMDTGPVNMGDPCFLSRVLSLQCISARHLFPIHGARRLLRI